MDKEDGAEVDSGSFGARTGHDPLGVDSDVFRGRNGGVWEEASCIGHAGGGVALELVFTWGELGVRLLAQNQPIE